MANATHHISVLLSANAGTFNGVMIAAGRSVSQLSRELDSTHATGSRAATLFKGAMATGAIAFGVAMAAAVRSAINFESEMRNVNSISKLTEAELASLSSRVLELSTRVPQSAQSLAKALYEIASSGFQGAEGFQILEASAKAATAGMSTTEVAAKAIVAVINAYGYEAKDAGYISDVLFKTVELGVLTFEELASQIGDVIGNASTATVGIEELGAAFATMTLSGISAAESATSLNGVIRKIINPTEKLQEAFQLLGYESGIQALEVDSLQVVMDKLRVVSGGNLAVIREWFNEIRSTRGALALMSNDGKNMARVWDEMSTSEKIAGATDAAFAEQMKATKAQLQLFGNQVQAVAIVLATELLGGIRKVIDGMRQLGGAAIPMVKSAIQALRPFWDGLRDSIENVIQILQDLWSAGGPTIKLIAGLAVWAVVGFLNTLGSVLSAVTGFLKDHAGAVQIAVLAYAAFKAASAIDPILTRLGTGFTNLKTQIQGTTVQVNSFRSIMASLGPGLALTVGLVGIQAFTNEVQKAHAAAEELIRTATKDVEMNNVESMADAMGQLRAQYSAAVREANEYKGIGDLFTEFAGLFTPLENPGLRAAVMVDDLGRSIVEMGDRMRLTGHLAQMLGDDLGMQSDSVINLANSIGLDLASAYRIMAADGVVTAEEIAGVGQKIQEAADAAENGTPATDAMAEGFGAIASEAATATEQLDAFKKMMDAIIGVHISSVEAAIAFENQMHDLTTAVAENGLTFDIATEAGRDNMSALADLTDAALDHASAVAEETGSIEEGNNLLALHREQIIQTMQSLGLSREAAELYAAQLGLTPENLETLVNLEGAAAAQAELERLAGELTNTDGLTATGYVIMDFSNWQGGYDRLQEQIFNFAHTQPTSTLFIDEEPAVADMATVMATLQAYGEQSPEAMALLQYAPAEKGFKSLQEWIDWFVGSDPMAAAYLNSDPARLRMDALFLQLGRYDLLSPEATAMVDTWGASWAINAVHRQLDTLNGRVVTSYANVYERYYAAPGGAGPGLPGSRRRWGGVDYAFARGGMMGAHVASGTRIKYAEPETGGEAYVPRLGDVRRSLAILETAAGWYGHTIAPMAEGGLVGGASGPLRSAPQVPVQVSVVVDGGGDRRFVEWLRNSVRVEAGGNAQVFFGAAR